MNTLRPSLSRWSSSSSRLPRHKQKFWFPSPSELFSNLELHFLNLRAQAALLVEPPCYGGSLDDRLQDRIVSHCAKTEVGFGFLNTTPQTCRRRRAGQRGSKQMTSLPSHPSHPQLSSPTERAPCPHPGAGTPDAQPTIRALHPKRQNPPSISFLPRLNKTHHKPPSHQTPR